MAASLNKVMLIGNTTKDVELKKIPSGQSVCAFSVATNRSWKDKDGSKKDQVEFHNIVVWGKLAEICAEYVKKGNKVYLEGRLQTREWEAQDGTKRRQTEIVADNMIMLSPKAGGVLATVRHNDMGGIETSAPEVDEIRAEDIPF